EEESSVGGAVACNSSGARSLKYGATRPHVRALTVVLADGRVLEVRRPQLEKNTAGPPLVQDPVDWFVGSEGTLGVVLAAEFALLPLPTHVTGLGVPFRTAQDALGFIAAARAARDHGDAGVQPRALPRGGRPQGVDRLGGAVRAAVRGAGRERRDLGRARCGDGGDVRPRRKRAPAPALPREEPRGALAHRASRRGDDAPRHRHG